MLDFSKINPFDLGQRASFEELVCQLASREKHPDGAIFKRVEGAGGDGGVEAYWTKPDGKKTGYQAKYFLRCGDIDWGQIDKSVKQALATHLELESYVIALPCNLTDKSGSKGRGKTGWQHWDNHIKTWGKHAKSLGIEAVKFEAWPGSKLLSKIIDQDHEGITSYFFGQIQLTSEWFKGRAQESIFSLGERFHPEDHVDVRAEKLFSIISRSPEFINQLDNGIQDIQKKSKVYNNDKSAAFAIPPHWIDTYKKQFQLFIKILVHIHINLIHEWKFLEFIRALEELERVNDEIISHCWKIYRNEEHSNDEKYELREKIRDLESLHESLNDFHQLLDSKYIIAEKTRVAFIRGEAGSGKSHLLAKCAQSAISEKRPTIFILGQRINDSDIWNQISQQLGLASKSADELLGLLDATGRANKSRVILLLDAINEGAGSKFWRNHLPNLIAKLNPYLHICCVISCRTEYFQLAVQSHLIERYPTFDIKGFETIDEQRNAARVYLDKRGISRPSTPWLAPEFINPLFLRSVCLSLEREGKSELPSGLNGTKKILEFYLRSIGKNIQEHENITISLSPNLGRATIAIAGAMIKAKADFISLDECRDLLASQFKNINIMTAADWLSVFLNNGILRKDPHPVSDQAFSDEEVVRFSFQRFQDFLMAEKVLDGADDPKTLFEDNGRLRFCIENSVSSWAWRGLISALGILLPEKFSIELIDTLPGGIESWGHNWNMHEIFCESVKWRSHEAFFERTIELFNLFWTHIPDPLELLVQISVSASHPWNANFLHNNLLKRKLADRDEFWSTWVNGQNTDDGVVAVLIEWCLHGQVLHTNKKNQALAALVLCWLLSSTNRSIRDQSTKSLSNIFLHNTTIFVDLLERFINIDDLYILERLLGAAYGACCINPSPDRLKVYTATIFEKVFKDGKPPFGILLRDYAFGIIELAEYHSALPGDVNVSLCRPPYSSPKPQFRVTEEQLDLIAKDAGSDAIKDSCISMMEDFSKHEIESRLGHFTKVSLSNGAPLSSEQKAKIFENDIIGNDVKRLKAYDDLRRTVNPYSYGLVASFSLGRKVKKPTPEKISQWNRDISIAEENLFSILTPKEFDLFKNNAKPYLYNRTREEKRHPKFDINLMKRWIAKRAYSYGWTEAKFSGDRYSNQSYSRDRPMIERIGKKYQWLALDELLSRLSDNYWLSGEYDKLPTAYSTPLDLGFQRDIEPTIIMEPPLPDYLSLICNPWALDRTIVLNHVAEEDLTNWPFEKNPAEGLSNLPFRTDLNGVKWVVLYEHQSLTETYGEERKGEHNLRIQEFRFLNTVMVKKGDVESFVQHFLTKKSLDVHSFMPPQYTDTAFYYEAPWRNVWDQEKWQFDSWKLPPAICYADLTCNYAWESHLDAALPNGYHSYLPSPWIAQKLFLKPDPSQPGIWLGSDNKTIFQELRGREGSAVCLLRFDKFEELLGGDCCHVSFLIAERNAWPGGGNTYATWRRTEGISWFDGKKMKSSSWNNDTKK